MSVNPQNLSYKIHKVLLSQLSVCENSVWPEYKNRAQRFYLLSVLAERYREECFRSELTVINKGDLWYFFWMASYGKCYPERCFVPFYFQTCWISEFSHCGSVIKEVQIYEKYISVKAWETRSTITTPLHNTIKTHKERAQGYAARALRGSLCQASDQTFLSLLSGLV